MFCNSHKGRKGTLVTTEVFIHVNALPMAQQGLVKILEAYRITKCSDYPDTDILAFRGINIQTGSSTPTLTWSPVNAVIDCGYRVIAASNSNPAGEVDLVSWLQAPSPAIVTSLTRYRDHIDLFVTGLEGGVYSTFWDANGGWFNHWFRL